MKKKPQTGVGGDRGKGSGERKKEKSDVGEKKREPAEAGGKQGGERRMEVREEDRAGRAVVLIPRGRSVSVRRKCDSRDSSTSSKRRKSEDTGEDDSMSETGSVCGSLRGELGVAKDLSASVLTVRGVEERDELSRMRMIGERLRKVVFSESNRVNKIVTEGILSCVSEYEECMMRMLCENERLKGRLEECRKVPVSADMSPVQGGNERSYARVAAAGGSTGVNVRSERMIPPVRVPERKYAVVIKPVDENSKLTSEQVKEKVMNEVSKSLNVRVRAVRKTRNGGIAVETVSENELKRMRECEKFGKIGLRVDEPRKIGPKIIVFDVPCVVTNDELLTELYEKNLKECVSEDEFKERVRVVSRTNKKDSNLGNVVFEMSVRMWNRLMSEGRVYIHWRACKLREFVSVLRCHKCVAYGHMARECKEKESICQKCSESGHLRNECKKSVLCCRNCRMKGNESDHSVMSVECPEYVRMAERERARVCLD